MTTPDEFTQALSAPFTPEQVRFKPQTVKNDRALAVAYIDCRTVQDRLDSVLGVAGWHDSYEMRPDGHVICTLQAKLGDSWVSKSDIGAPSEQPDVGDRHKAAFSDALKRAAVKFGIGRYLYRLPMTWVEYDAAKRKFAKPPTLPAWALPSATPVVKLPQSGAEFFTRLQACEEKLVANRQCDAGELQQYIKQLARDAGIDEEMTAWPAEAIELATQAVRVFLKRLPQRSPRAAALV